MADSAPMAAATPWEDITAELVDLSNSLSTGQMVHEPAFNLAQAMSAVSRPLCAAAAVRRRHAPPSCGFRLAALLTLQI